MSAYVVTSAHIDALVTAGLELPRRRREGAELRWSWSGAESDLGPEFGLSEWRTDLDSWGNVVDYRDGQAMGQTLLEENALSVAYRYREPAVIPGYVFRRFALEPVHVLGALRCYRYQSCEHPGWEASEAFAFCSALEEAAIDALPGIDDVWDLREADRGREVAAR